jgi:hypothetical protein
VAHLEAKTVDTGDRIATGNMTHASGLGIPVRILGFGSLQQHSTNTAIIDIARARRPKVSSWCLDGLLGILPQPDSNPSYRSFPWLAVR